MLLEILIFLFLGIAIGTFTGLIPGIHTNLVGAILISLSTGILFKINSVYLVVFIVALAITHTFVDFIPSIFLGCPDTDTELSVLPGHELLKDKRGYEAVQLSNYGSLIAIILVFAIIIPFFFLLKDTYSFLQKYVPYILILVSLIIIFTEKNKFNSILAFLLTGILGTIVLNLNFNESLLPLLSGLFGASGILLSIKNKTKIPKQIISKPDVSFKKPIIAGIISSPLSSLLPALGSNQIAVIGNLFTKNSRHEFLVLIGITNTLSMAISFITFYLIGKTRTGASVAVKELLTQITLNHLILILIVILISGISAFFITEKLARFFSNKIEKINYTVLSYVTLGILIAVVAMVSGFLGLLILIISTFTGIYCIQLNVKRTNMMGCLILPTILLLFGIIGG